MKQHIKLFISCLLISTFANAQSVNFVASDWNALQKNSKESNKYLFIDCMTDWCSWCKVMDKETFKNEEVAKYMNANFVSTQMDMEKGFGTTLAAKYRVSSFPTFLIFNPQGKLIYRGVGYQKPDDFMVSLNHAADPTMQMNFPGIGDKMDPGFPDFYKGVFAEKDQRKKVEPGTADKFLDNQKDLTNEVSWSVMARFKVNDKYNQYFLNNISAYRKLYGSEAETKLDAIIYGKLNQAITEKSNDIFKQTYGMIDQYMLGDKEGVKQNFMLRYYSGVEDWSKFAAEFQTYLTKTDYKEASTINSYCWDIYEKCNDAVIILKSCEWMKRAIQNESQYAYLDTYAALLYKNKNYPEADRMATLAIETGKKENQDVKETEALQVKIKDALAGK